MVRVGASLIVLFVWAGSAAPAAAADSAVDAWLLPQQRLTNSAGQPVITPLQAEALVQAVWDERDAGAAVGSPAAIQALETGPAALFDRLSAYGDIGEITQAQVYVPRQVAYPAYFLALVSTYANGRPDRQDGLVFTRTGSAAAWKLDIDSAFTGWASTFSDIPVDGYVATAPVPAGDGWVDAAEQGQFYGIALPTVPGQVELVCYAVRSASTTSRSWLQPRRVIDPQTGRPHNYTTVTSTALEQDCAILPLGIANPDPYLVGSMRRTIDVTGSLQPPPWLWIGVAGALLVLLSGALLGAVRAPMLPAAAEQAKPEAKPTPVRPFTAFERDHLRGTLILLTIEVAVLAEVVRWLAVAHLGLALAIVVLALLWITGVSTPWPRRTRARSSLVIPAAPHQVWNVLTDELDQRTWPPQMVSVERVSGTGDQGSVYRQVQRSPVPGGLLEALKLVSVYEPERRYVLRYPYLWQPQTERYTLEADGAGTLLTYQHETVIGPLAAICGVILMRSGFKARLQATTGACLQRIRARTLGQPPPVQPVESTAAPAPRPVGRSPRNALLIGAGVMLLSALLSLGGYALLFGVVFGSLVMAVLVIHELGHYAEARRQGLPVHLPFFIPFVGAAVTMRRMPGDAGTHARIAMAGPLAGTLAVAATCLAEGPTNAQGLILFAQVGGLLNLVNLLPVGVLDGGTILAPLSRWVSVIGVLIAIGLVATLVLSHQFSLLVAVIAGLAVFSMVNRFRKHGTTYYRSVGRKVPLLIGSVWLLTFLYLCFVTGVTGIGLMVS
jgi:Zn-dependent protease